MELTVAQIALLFGAGLLAGGANAIAGGGTFFTFPALLSVGLPPVVAIASNALAVWPGHAAAVPAFLPQLKRPAQNLTRRSLIALSGGVIGALLLLATEERVFTPLIPWLLLLATGIFAFGGQLRMLLLRLPARLHTPSVYLGIEFLFAIYGGYFGAGLGVLLIACLVITGHGDLHEINGLKNWLASLISTVAIAVFAWSGLIAWAPALVVMAGAVVGGYGGARLSQQIPHRLLRLTIIGIGLALSLYYFS